MVWIPALSVQEQVERVGAYVGIASFFGIALLAVLYFAQARELKRLRDWAGRAPERARELEERVAEDAARRADAQAAAQTAAPAAPAVPAVAAGAAAIAAVPAGEATDGEREPASEPGGAEAVPAAERVDGRTVSPAAVPAGATGAGDGAPGGVVSDETPEPASAGSDRGAATPLVATTVAGTAVPPVATAARAGDAPTGGEPAAGGSAAPSGVDHPDAPAADDGRSTLTDDSAAAPRTDVAEPGAARPAGAGPRPATAAALRVGAEPSRVARRPAPVTPTPVRPPRRRGGKLIGLGLAGLVAVVGGAFALSSAGDDEPATTPTVTEAGSPAPAPTATVDPATARQDTTVAVLNGTTTDGLAARLVDRLTAVGYQEGPRGNYADQQRTSSVVYYREGAADPARDVASVLEISEVAPIDAQTAAQPIGDAQVVVVAGHDQAP